jgi:DNA-binding NarL/FixJ family response regulator
VSPKTVEFHLRHIYQKLDIASRTELTKLIEDEAGG